MVARKRDEIPETFRTMEEAGAFWDTHSLADYEDQTRTVELDFAITRRTRYISVPEKIYKKLTRCAHRKNRTVREMLFDFAK
jgi:hypothetical protein